MDLMPSAGMTSDPFSHLLFPPLLNWWTLEAWVHSLTTRKKLLRVAFVLVPISICMLKSSITYGSLYSFTDSSDEALASWWANVQSSSRLTVLGLIAFYYLTILYVEPMIKIRHARGKAIATSGAFKKRTRQIALVLTWAKIMMASSLIFDNLL